MTDQTGAQPESFWVRNYFLLRRLHSVTGLFPVGVFLFFHLVTNSTVLDRQFPPGRLFQENVNKIHSLGSLLPIVEWTFILLPLMFHAGLGLVIWWKASYNVVRYPYVGNIRYTLQRMTGVIALAFILFHVGTLWAGNWTPFHHERIPGRPDVLYPAYVSTAEALQAAWWVTPVYALGIASVVFHFANGLWTGLITWGVTIGSTSQRASGYLCTALGIVLGIFGLGALYGFTTTDLGGVERAAVQAHQPPAPRPAGQPHGRDREGV